MCGKYYRVTAIIVYVKFLPFELASEQKLVSFSSPVSFLTSERPSRMAMSGFVSSRSSFLIATFT